MREILFRAKEKHGSQWVEGHYAVTYEKKNVIILTKPQVVLAICRSTPMAEIDRGTLSQFTGFTDKNGVKIFENDIVEAFRGDPELQAERSVVTWLNGAWALKYFRDGCRPDPLYEENVTVLPNLEVVGNIFDNPEEGR